MIVLLDSNEVSTAPRILKELERVFPKVLIPQGGLKFGDLNVILEGGKILAVERKTISDFLNSIGDGRVFRQVETMASHARFYAVIIEGSLQIHGESDMVIANGELTKWSGSSVRAALFNIQWSGCPVWFCPEGTYAFTVEEMAKIAEKDEEHLQKNHHRIVTFPPIEVEQDILMAFPGIGWKRSESLLKFTEDRNGNGKPCLAEVLAWASAMDMVPKGSRPVGWGNSYIQKFREVLGLKPGEYINIVKEGENGSSNGAE